MKATAAFMGINRIRLEFKECTLPVSDKALSVLIESDWNLKVVEPPPTFVGIMVLIESDWNLKVRLLLCSSFPGSRINRIRLEFKGLCDSIKTDSCLVLIESDWNLKYKLFKNSFASVRRINRIRLEFKV